MEIDPRRQLHHDELDTFAASILQSTETLTRLNQLYSELNHLQTRPDFYSRHPTMSDAVRSMIGILKPADVLIKRNSELPTVIFTIQAMPGSGKSYTADRVCEILSIEGIDYDLIHWDRVERDLQLEGIIQTNSDQPFTEEDLQAVYDRVLQLMKELAQPGIVLLLDLPSETSVRVSANRSNATSDTNNACKMLHARRYATNISDEFSEWFVKQNSVSQNKAWEHSNRNQHKNNEKSPLHIFENHLLPGPPMDLLRRLRDALSLLKDLNRPNEIRALFGLDPLSAEELEKIDQKLGGSAEQVEVADAAWHSLLQTIRERTWNAITLDFLNQMIEMEYNDISQLDQLLPVAIELPNVDDLHEQIDKVAKILSQPTDEYSAYVQQRLAVITLILHNSQRTQTDQDIDTQKAVSTFLSNPDYLFKKLFADSDKMGRLQKALRQLDFIRVAARRNWKSSYDYLISEFEKLLVDPPR